MRKIKIGTRKSQLALWQTRYVVDLLQKNNIDSEIVEIDTKGDQIQSVALHKIGDKGLFTHELEEQLKKKKIDIAVHSAKDLPSSFEDDFYILSFCEREKSHDVILAFEKPNLKKPNLTLATSSVRRIALLKHYYPNITTVDIRGNLQTRIKKLRQGIADGLILAFAGVERMNYTELIHYQLDKKQFVPPVGQGAIAIETHTGLEKNIAHAIKQATNHANTERCIITERNFLRRIDGGCSVPAFGYATWANDQEIEMMGGVISTDGKTIISKTTLGKDESVGVDVADYLLENGAKEILDHYRKKK